MAVISISKIQVRRGLQENLPQLASGEMGWSIDERRLYIGNGTTSEGAPIIGNTEILTQNSDVISAIKTYVFKGDESGYTSRTGPTIATFVQRSLQHKIDEQISLRDFITHTDVLSGDYTAALQRAIDQIFPIKKYNSFDVRRVLHIPAGLYLITSEITIPPYASISGDGPLSTVIRQVGTTDVSFILRDSFGQSGAGMLGINGAQLPLSVNITNLTLEHSTNGNIVDLDSATNINFDRVIFKGSLVDYTTNITPRTGVQLLSSVGPTTRVSFNQCEFTQLTQGIVIDNDVSGILVNDCLFTSLYRGVVVASSSTTAPRHIKIVSSTFDDIATSAIISTGNSSIISAYNYYKDVGYSKLPLPIAEVLTWDNANNYSIGDTFQRPIADRARSKLIKITDTIYPIDAQASTSGSATVTPGHTELLANNTTANTSLILTSITSAAIIDYSITRGTSNRIGTLKLSHTNGEVIYEDDYTEIGNPNIILNFNSDGDNAVMEYISANVGTSATLRYTIRSFI